MQGSDVQPDKSSTASCSTGVGLDGARPKYLQHVDEWQPVQNYSITLDGWILKGSKRTNGFATKSL